MKRLLIALTSAVLFAGGGLLNAAPARADAAPYSDRAMHFVPPDGFESVDVPAVDLSEQAHLTTVAAYVRNRGKEDQLTIVIMMRLFEGPLGDFESVMENDLRSQIDGLFVSKKELTRLPNGMPGYWLKLAYGEGFDSMQQYVYAAIDGQRGVAVSITGHLGVMDESKAKDALKNLAVVVYQ